MFSDNAAWKNGLEPFSHTNQGTFKNSFGIIGKEELNIIN
jgi:hypothetical protein